MTKIFIRVKNNNHLECINYLASLGGKLMQGWSSVEDFANDCKSDTVFSITSTGFIAWNSLIPVDYKEVFLNTEDAILHCKELLLQNNCDISAIV